VGGSLDVLGKLKRGKTASLIQKFENFENFQLGKKQRRLGKYGKTTRDGSDQQTKLKIFTFNVYL
jgi:hypothetical protein